MAGLRPLLFVSNLEDPEQKIGWSDQHYTRIPGGRGAVERVDDVIYMAISVRNIGAGMAVLHGWHPHPWEAGPLGATVAPEEFRRLTRDIYIPPGGLGFWQGAVRDDDDPLRPQITAVYENRERFLVDVLYGDLEGGQRTITRFSMTPLENGLWLSTVGRHWHLDRVSPR